MTCGNVAAHTHTHTHLTDFVTADAQRLPQDGVRLTDELHVAVLDAVVDHLDEVSGTLGSHPVAARLLVALGADRLEDRLQVRPTAQKRNQETKHSPQMTNVKLQIEGYVHAIAISQGP